MTTVRDGDADVLNIRPMTDVRNTSAGSEVKCHLIGQGLVAKARNV